MSETGKILIVTVGLPRSGKTTWAREQHIPIVCPDAIRSNGIPVALHGQRYIGLVEPWVWAMAKTMVRALFLAGHNEIILDSTMMTRARRDEWLSKDWQTLFHYINTPVDICILRAKVMKDEEIIPVINRMANQFEPLESDELLSQYGKEG